MRIFLDTEFDRFHLLSIALVAEDGTEFYEILNQLGIPVQEKWVEENVVSVLGDKEQKLWHQIADDLKEFINKYDHPTIICDWAQDLWHLTAMFEHPIYENSLDKRITFELLTGLPDLKSKIPHNALSDARALRDWYLRENDEFNKEPPQKFFR